MRNVTVDISTEFLETSSPSTWVCYCPSAMGVKGDKDIDGRAHGDKVSMAELTAPVKELKEKWKLVPAFLQIKGAFLCLWGNFPVAPL